MKKILKKDKMKIKTIITIVLIIFLLTISTGYSYLHAKLKIEGKSTIIAQPKQVGEYQQGQSTSSWSIVSQSNLENALTKIYDIKINIVNNDEDANSWAVGMDVPTSYDVTKQKIKCASTTQYENGRLTLYSTDWNAQVAKGQILTLEFQIAINGETELSIDNITFNGLLTQNLNN